MTISRFFSVAARGTGRVVARASKAGPVWCWRAPRKGDKPSPSAYFVPAWNMAEALTMAQVLRAEGHACSVKAGPDCSVWASGPMRDNAPPFAVKVLLPVGATTADLRDRVPAIQYEIDQQVIAADLEAWEYQHGIA